MGQLDHVRSMIILFVMDGCEHCEDLKPRFVRLVEGWMAHGIPLQWYVGNGQAIPRGVIPVLIIDATSTDETVVSLADQYEIEGLPSTLLLTRNAKPVKLEGAITDQEVYDLLTAAALANR